MKLVTLARRLGSLLLAVIITALCLVGFLGCGMIGSTDFYVAVGEMCARCHMPGAKPSKATLKPEKPTGGPEGPSGAEPGTGSCPFDCPYAVGRK